MISNFRPGKIYAKTIYLCLTYQYVWVWPENCPIKLRGELTMKYLFAWILGVPGGLIVLWFLFNHMH
jgi:hypothetical protein